MLNKIFSFLLTFCVCLSGTINANQFTSEFSRGQTFSKTKPLSSEEAFHLSVSKSDESVSFFFEIAPKHYLYKDQLKLKINNIEYSNYSIPNVITKHDIHYGDTDVIYDSLFFEVNAVNISDIEITYRGCSEEFNICYPPEVRQFSYAAKELNKSNNQYQANKNQNNYFNLNNLTRSLSTDSILFNVFIFFIAGILISLTPCVLPMIPIISAIIINQNQIKSIDAFKLSFSYVIGSATAYSMIGIITAMSSKNIQIYIQHPYFIFLSSIVMFVLALSMFDVFEIKSSSKLNTKINDAINKLKSENVFTIFIIGFLSTLIISPCVAAPLAASVLYITSTGNVAIGGASLFSFGLGTGVSLIVISTSLNRIKIRAGSFMNEIKYFIGAIMVFCSIYLLERIYSGFYLDLLYYSLFLLYSLGVYKRNPSKLIIALLLFINIFFIHETFYKTIDNPNLTTINDFTYINNIEEYNAAIANKNAFIKVTADWCVYCQHFNKNVLTNKEVSSTLENFNKYVIDITKTNNEKDNLLNHIGLFAPPAFIIVRDNKIKHKEMGNIELNKFLNILNN